MACSFLNDSKDCVTFPDRGEALFSILILTYETKVPFTALEKYNVLYINGNVITSGF